MTMPRTIELHMTDDGIAQVTAATDGKEILRIIGLLTLWSTDALPRVVIELDNDTDLIARYYRPDGELGHVVNIVWHDDHYDIEFVI
jgi:hypothetical protein